MSPDNAASDAFRLLIIGGFIINTMEIIIEKGMVESISTSWSFLKSR
jgi:hypothetical protein